jgi:chromosome segregation ATPase
MKEAIIGYVTGMVNIHQMSAESFEGSGETIALDFVHNAIANELISLLDFIEDSKEEESQSSETIYRAGQYESLVKQLEQLKECLHSGDAERIVLRKRARELQDKITEWEKNNSKQLQKIKELREDNISWQNTCNILKDKLEKWEGTK